MGSYSSSAFKAADIVFNQRIDVEALIAMLPSQDLSKLWNLRLLPAPYYNSYLSSVTYLGAFSTWIFFAAQIDAQSLPSPPRSTSFLDIPGGDCYISDNRHVPINRFLELDSSLASQGYLGLKL